MSTYRFLSTCNQPDIFLATVVEAKDRRDAQAKMSGRLMSDEEVVSVNMLEGKSWLVLEGQAIEADKIRRHSNTGVGVFFEGAAVPSGDSAPEVRQPTKAGGKSAPIAESAAPQSSFTQAGGQDASVKFMIGLTAFLAFAALVIGMMIEDFLVFSIALVPAIITLVATFGIYHLSGIHKAMLRMAEQQSGK